METSTTNAHLFAIRRVGVRRDVFMLKTGSMASTFTFENWNTLTISQPSVDGTTAIFSDSTAAISLAKSEQVAAGNKHTYIKTHHIKELIQTKIIQLYCVHSRRNITDILTKPVSTQTLHELRRMLNLEVIA